MLLSSNMILFWAMTDCESIHPVLNRHSGPELFTFDNHDPKGGCVLLNDGTVKFIRTKEELNALKWK